MEAGLVALSVLAQTRQRRNMRVVLREVMQLNLLALIAHIVRRVYIEF